MAVEPDNPARDVVSTNNEAKADDKTTSNLSEKGSSESPTAELSESSHKSSSSLHPKSSSITDTMTFFADKARTQIAEQMNIIAESAKTQFNKIVINPIIEKAKRDAILQAYDVRELFPRTGWHDVHSSVNGLVARDIASHFIQVRIYLQLCCSFCLR